MRNKIIFVCTLVFVLGCQNPFNPANPIHQNELPPGMGSFSLAVDGERTILPNTTKDSFLAYTLDFSGTDTLSVDRTNAALSDPVTLKAGSYSLTLTAYMDTAKAKPAAAGSLTGITITDGQNTSGIVPLAALGMTGGTGTFSWNIGFPVSLSEVSMKITPVNTSTGTAEQTLYFVGGVPNASKTDSVELKSGVYRVVFTLKKNADTQTVTWRDVVHVYQNMASAFSYAFTDAHFNNIKYAVTVDYDDGTSPVPVDCLHGEVFATPAAPAKTGYTFDKWYTDAAKTAAAVFPITVTANVNLYAKWNITTYTVTYDADGGVPAPADGSKNHGETITQPAAMTKTGYTFDKWYTDAAKTAAAVFPITVTANVNLYAKWNVDNTITSPIGIVMVPVPGGSFEMGKDLGTAATEDVTPVHTVTLTGFYMGKYHVTRAQYRTVMGSVPPIYSVPSGEVADNFPVEPVSWYDALVFCNKLSMLEGLSPAYSMSGYTDPASWGNVPISDDSSWNSIEIVSGSNGYRLPTEAQWEYAAKGGNQTAPGWVGYTYPGSDDVNAVAWYVGNSYGNYHEVGKKAPNGLGLYDMSGNMEDFCWDRHGDYSSEAQIDPTGAVYGTRRVTRGGSAGYSGVELRSVCRRNIPAWDTFTYISFRLVRPDISVAPTYGISLSATGTQTFTAAAVGYGTQTALTVTVTNTGNQATGSLTAALSGTNTGSFTLSTTSISSIAVGGTGTFTVVPNTGLAAGTYTATITVSGGNGITANFNVSFTVNAAGGPITSIEMVQIPAGTFTMGSPTTESGRNSDETQHQVTMSAFSIGKYQVTQDQYRTVMGAGTGVGTGSPSSFTTAVAGESETPGKLPVERVSWYDVLVFCNKLSVMEGLSPAYSINGSTDTTAWGAVPTTANNAAWDAVTIVSGSNGYRLPTEAQWEYACRAGTTTAYNTGDTISDNTGWYTSNSGSKTHQVGLKTANAWGLYDMHGNVYEWCWDWYGTYTSGAQTDPTGASSGYGRVFRGGTWGSSDVRSATRSSGTPTNRYDFVGFRLVRP